MAAGSSDYKIGSMAVEAQKGTFGGFMSMTVYGSCLIAVLLMYPILVFCTALAWVPSLVLTVVFGIVLGVALRLKGGWFASVIGLAIFLALLSLFVIWMLHLITSGVPA